MTKEKAAPTTKATKTTTTAPKPEKAPRKVLSEDDLEQVSGGAADANAPFKLQKNKL